MTGKEYFKKNIYWALSCFFCFSVIVRILSDIIKGYKKESFQITEWLINYQGGFVRRGLAGEGIFQISNYTHISPYYLIIGISLLLYIAVVFIFLALLKKNRFQHFFLLSPVLLGMPVFSNFWVRKDLLLVLIFTSCLLLVNKRFKGRLLFINLLLCLGILSHEGFSFWGLGSIFILLAAFHLHHNKSKLHSFIFTTIQLIPSLITFIISFIHKGNSAIVKGINQSWENKFFPYHESVPTDFTAIHALEWPLKKGLEISFSTFTTITDGIIYAPVIWLITLMIFVLLSCTILLIPQNNHSDSSTYYIDNLFIKIFILQGFLISPLFILGQDYGRWMFLWGISALGIRLIIPANFIQSAFLFIPVIPDFLEKKITTLSDSAGRYFSPYRISIFILFWGIPLNAWSIHHFIHTTPAFQPIMALKRILIDKLNLINIF